MIPLLEEQAIAATARLVDNAVRIHAARVIAEKRYADDGHEAGHCVMMAKLILAVAERDELKALHEES